MPWPYVRRQIARAWGVPPWVVDWADADEVATELALMNLEAQWVRPEPTTGARRGGRRS